MIEQGDLAERISNRSSDLKDWLMTLDILKVLEGVVELMKTVSDNFIYFIRHVLFGKSNIFEHFESCTPTSF